MSSSSLRPGNEYKIVLLGEGSVGKTSLALRYTQNVFQEQHLATVQASFFQKRLNLNGQRIVLNIWDTAGQERYHALSPIYYRDAQGALLVYDITDANSFKRIQEWIKELHAVLGNRTPIILVGNKCDRVSQRAVTAEQVEKFAREEILPTLSLFDDDKEREAVKEPIPSIDGFGWITLSETSARLGENVEQTFLALASSIIRHFPPPKLETNAASSAVGSGLRKRLQIVELDESETPSTNRSNGQKPSSCCIIA